MILLAQISKKASQLYKSVTTKSRQAWHNTLKAAATLLKREARIQDVKTTFTAYCGYYPTAEKKAVLSVINSIATEAIEVGNTFIADVCTSVVKFKKLSEKQAYVIARFYVDAGLDYGDQYYFSI
jgi:hypothetical protein